MPEVDDEETRQARKTRQFSTIERAMMNEGKEGVTVNGNLGVEDRG